MLTFVQVFICLFNTHVISGSNGSGVSVIGITITTVLMIILKIIVRITTTTDIIITLNH